MATKEGKLFPGYDQSVADNKSTQFSNFNLNKTHPSSNSSSFDHSYSKLKNDKKIDHTVTDSNNQGLTKSWNKSTKDLCLKSLKKNFYNETEEENELQKRWMKSDNSDAAKKKSSTLSLHIAAYENSAETSDKSDKDLSKKSNAFKLGKSVAKVQDDFEFPRQTPGNEPAGAPQVMQFKASQKLLSPNQGPAPLRPASKPQSLAGTSVTQSSGATVSSNSGGNNNNNNNASSNTDSKCVLDVTEFKLYGGIFYGSLPLEDIELFLSQPGDFILRNLETKTLGKQLVITVKTKSGYKNLPIKNKDGQFCLPKTSKYPSISELVINLVTLKVPIDSAGDILKKPIYRPSWIFLHSQVKFGRKLGAGAFGEVYIARLKANDGSQEFAFPVAIKTMHNKINLESKLEFLKEARVMQKLEHPNIVRVYGVAACGNPVLLAMEICSGGALLSHLKKHKERIKLPRKCRYAYEAAQGLAYLEKCGIIHRDIAARNCMLTSNLSIKVGDFGMAETLSEMVVPELKKVPIKWLAIETMQKKIYSHKTDVWAYGILLFEIFGNGEAPYQGFTNMQVRAKIVIQNYRLPPPKDTPEPVADLMKRCWLTEPKERPSFAQISQELSKLAEPSPRNQPRKSLSDPRKIRKRSSSTPSAAADGKKKDAGVGAGAGAGAGESEKVLKKAKARKVSTTPSIPLIGTPQPSKTPTSATPTTPPPATVSNLDKSLGRSTKVPKHEKPSTPGSGSDLDKSMGKSVKKPKVVVVAAATAEKPGGGKGSDLDKSLGKSQKKKKEKKEKKKDSSSGGSSEEKAPPSSGGIGSAENSKEKKKNKKKINPK